MVIQKRNANEYETDEKASNLPIKHMQIKMIHHFFTIKMANIKKNDNTQCW